MPSPLRIATRRLRLESLERRSLMSVNVLTYHNDNTRDGANLQETTLTQANVNSAQFGKLFSDATDGQVYAQPLYMSGVSIPGKGTHDIVIVATENDSVYAFDAETPGAPLWQTSFLSPGVTAVPSVNVSFNLISPQVGITGTPVIDPSTGTLYVDAATMVTSGSTVTYLQTLHALNVTTGKELAKGEVVVQATVPGTGLDSVNGQVTFNPEQELNRGALTLANGDVYLTFASYGGTLPYHGWVIGYNARTLKEVGAFNDTPNASEGGIWMAADGAAVDPAGNLFISTGNGPADLHHDLSDSVIKLSPNLTLKDDFTPDNEAQLQQTDSDMCAGGLILLPSTSGTEPNVLAANKRGTIYLTPGDNLGKYNATYDAVTEELNGAVNKLFSVPAYYNGNVYYVANSDALKDFSYVNGLLSTTAVAQSSTIYGFPGATPSVSANGTNASTAIVWTIEQTSTQAAVLHAYAANNVADELYNSTQAGTRDSLGAAYDTFTTPTVANGHVYIAYAGGVAIFGLLPTTPAAAVKSSGASPAVLPGLAASQSTPAAGSALLVTVTTAASDLAAAKTVVSTTVTPLAASAIGSRTLVRTAAASAVAPVKISL